LKQYLDPEDQDSPEFRAASGYGAREKTMCRFASEGNFLLFDYGVPVANKPGF